MRDPTAKSHLMDLFVSVQKKKASNPKKTDVRLQTATPVWDAFSELTILPNHIRNIIVDILVYSNQGTLNKDREIGRVC